MMAIRLNLSGRNHLPVIRQNEAAECGLAALAMVAGFYGFKTDLATLRRKFAMGLQGMTLRHVIDVAIKMEFGTRPIKVPLQMISQVKLPAILHWDMNHFVVLKAVSKNRFTVHDPAFGERVYEEEEFSQHFTGVALELTPTEKFKNAKRKCPLS